MLSATKNTNFYLVTTDLDISELNSFAVNNHISHEELLKKNVKVFLSSFINKDNIDITTHPINYSSHVYFIEYIHNRINNIINEYIDILNCGMHFYLFDEDTFHSFFGNQTSNYFYHSSYVSKEEIDDDNNKWFRGDIGKIRTCISNLCSKIATQVEDLHNNLYIPDNIIWDFYIDQFIVSFKATKNYAWAVSIDGKTLYEIGDTEPLYPEENIDQV